MTAHTQQQQQQQHAAALAPPATAAGAPFAARTGGGGAPGPGDPETRRPGAPASGSARGSGNKSTPPPHAFHEIDTQ
jgi:hypothetical protein